MDRLQKYMAQSGVASRRHSEELIKEGKVSVNGEVITEMGYKVKNSDIITVNGIPIAKEEYKYYVINKPRYILSTVSDDKGRKTVISILPSELLRYRLFPVGRLDYDTKGILLLTNDGNFMNALVGPQTHTEKEYLVRVEGIVTKEEVKKLSEGVKIDNYTTRKCQAFIDSVDGKNKSSLLRLVLQEGKYHQVKRMVEAIGHPAKNLTRVRFGCVKLEDLSEGTVRELSISEIRSLLNDSKKEKTYVQKKVRKI